MVFDASEMCFFSLSRVSFIIQHFSMHIYLHSQRLNKIGQFYGEILAMLIIEFRRQTEKKKQHFFSFRRDMKQAKSAKLRADFGDEGKIQPRCEIEHDQRKF